MTAVRIVTHNSPHRYGDGNNARDNQRLADRGNSVIANQEVPQADVRQLCPKGWRYHRGPARSEVIYWDPKVWEVLGRGAFKLSSKKGTERYALWVLLGHRKTGVIRKFASLHLVAFKTSSKKHAVEYEFQAARLAEWFAAGDRRVGMGDLNGGPDGHWLAPVMKVANVHTPPTKSGPEGQFIDLILTAEGIPRAIGAEALKGYHGDHKPVEAELQLT